MHDLALSIRRLFVSMLSRSARVGGAFFITVVVLLVGSTYSELRGLMKESFKRSKPDWLVLLLRRGHLWQELLLQRQ